MDKGYLTKSHKINKKENLLLSFTLTGSKLKHNNEIRGAFSVAQFVDQENTLKKDRATHSSILAWEIQWTEEPGGIQSMGLQNSQT